MQSQSVVSEGFHVAAVIDKLLPKCIRQRLSEDRASDLTADGSAARSRIESDC